MHRGGAEEEEEWGGGRVGERNRLINMILKGRVKGGGVSGSRVVSTVWEAVGARVATSTLEAEAVQVGFAQQQLFGSS